MLVETLYKCEYITGHLETIDVQSIINMVLKQYRANKNMDKDVSSIRNEDIRIEFNSEIQKLAKELCAAWHEYSGNEIELCWNSTMKNVDPNEAAWAVVHSRGESTNLHSHESSENYSEGAHVSAAFWAQCPKDSGNFVFQYKPNTYVVEQHSIEPQPGNYAMFDSTISHFVTKNCTDDLRIVISMNFKYKDR